MGRFGLTAEEFTALGDYAEAGLSATVLALTRAARSAAQGRIPIAGAVVVRQADGTLEVVTVGNNGRIPAPGETTGYPTDHGETAAVRCIDDVSTVDWGRAVFATTLSPCIMCGRTLTALWRRGLRRVVIAESQSFAGTREQLEVLDGMTVVALTCPDAVAMMQAFAQRHPWDWAADIGEIPPGDLHLASALPAGGASMLAVVEERGHAAGVFGADGRLLASAPDGRAESRNPTHSATMVAMGRAGSAVNLRECTLVLAGTASLDRAGFGEASLGACELFRPAAILTRAPLSAALAGPLQAAGIRLVSLLP
ncbi:MAG: hypothetical protein P8R54_33560 [Myxococcota bacterium]|nr:hypothetical protein [Myxococcota bacterium]